MRGRELAAKILSMSSSSSSLGIGKMISRRAVELPDC